MLKKFNWWFILVFSMGISLCISQYSNGEDGMGWLVASICVFRIGAVDIIENKYKKERKNV